MEFSADSVLSMLEKACIAGFFFGRDEQVFECDLEECFHTWLQENVPSMHAFRTKQSKIHELEEAKARVAALQAELDADSSCQSCSAAAEPEHTCPFAEDIHGDYESLCNCCLNFQHECAMDI